MLRRPRHEPIGDDQTPRRSARSRSSVRSESTARRRRPTRWGRWLVGLLLIASLAAGLLAPQLLQFAVLRNLLLDQTVPRQFGSVRIDRLILGWLSPIEMEGLQLADGAGRSLAAVGRFRTELPLWRLLQHPRNLGVVHLADVELWVHVRPNGSNWEDALAEARTLVTDQPGSEPVQVQVRVDSGTAHLTDSLGHRDELSKLTGWLDLPADPAAATSFALQCETIPVMAQPAGTVQLHGSWTRGSGAADESASNNTVRLDVQAETLPVGLTRYASLRVGQPIDVQGTTSGALQIELRPAEVFSLQRAVGALSFAPLEFVLPGPTAERLSLPTARAEFEAVAEQGLVHVHRCDFDSPLASAKFAGRIAVDQPLRLQPFTLQGQLDVAEVAKQAPRAIRLRDDVQLTSGTVSWQVTHRPLEEGRGELAGELLVQDLKGVKGVVLGPEAPATNLLGPEAPATYGLRDPVRARFRLRIEPSDVVADELIAEAPFARLELHGRLSHADLRVEADLAELSRELGQFVDLGPGPLSGRIALQAEVQANRQAIGFDSLRISLRDVAVTTATRSFSEPAVELTASGQYQFAPGLLACQNMTFSSTALSLQADALQVATHSPRGLTGEFDFRGDLARLWQHLAPGSTARLLGHWTGRAALSADSAGVAVRAASRIDGLQWQANPATVLPASANGVQTVWQEPTVQLDLRGRWAAATGELQIEEGVCQAQSGGAQFAGNILPLRRPPEVNLRGATQLNLDELTARLRPWLGPNVQLIGNVPQPFWLKGPPELAGQFGIGWQSVSAHGILGGPGSLVGQVQQQELHVDPFEVPVSQGQLRLTPRLSLVAPYRLSLEPGPVLERVAITPEMCRGWLKYFAPLLADAATADGLISLRLARGELPLSAPGQAAAGGAISIHRGQIGPGPLARQLLTVASTIQTLVDPRGNNPRLNLNSTWVMLPEQVVSFRVSDGQVAHQDLTMLVGDVTIRTRGWVGFNQQLGLLAEVPVQDRWVASQPYLAGLRGQTIKIPIHGTLQQPNLDQRALQQIAQQAVRGAAEGLLQQEFRRQLEQLFK